MKFTQFLFPRGEKQSVEIEMPEEIEKMSEEMEKAGWRFEIECFPETQLVNMDCCNDEEQLSGAICQNGPDVPIKVEKIVRDAYKKLKSRN